MKTGTLFFQDKNGDNVLALNNINKLELTSNVTEEVDAIGNVENIKRGEITMSLTDPIENEICSKHWESIHLTFQTSIIFILQNLFKDENIRRKESIKSG